MLDIRLELALNGDGLVLPESGAIAVFHPSIELDLAGIPQDLSLIHI